MLQKASTLTKRKVDRCVCLLGKPKYRMLFLSSFFLSGGGVGLKLQPSAYYKPRRNQNFWATAVERRHFEADIIISSTADNSQSPLQPLPWNITDCDRCVCRYGTSLCLCGEEISDWFSHQQHHTTWLSLVPPQTDVPRDGISNLAYPFHPRQTSSVERLSRFFFFTFRRVVGKKAACGVVLLMWKSFGVFSQHGNTDR